MRKLTVLAGALLAAAATLGSAATPAGAGGWAVSSLDATPAPVAGEEVQVGFTVRQHGVRPVNPGGEVGIEVRSGSGAVTEFPARPEGPTGHYVADVTFPRAGRFTWQVVQGWFRAMDLGTIDVAPAGGVPDGAAATTVAERAPSAVRTLVALVGVAGLGLILADRRRPRAAVAAVVR